MAESYFRDYFATLGERLHDASDDDLSAVCRLLNDVRGRGKIIAAGNGASAAIASHVTVDLMKSTSIRAMAFNDADLITCFGNDYGYENWVAKAIECYGDRGDVAILISSSGKSPNIVNAAHRARELGLSVITLSGFAPDNPLRQIGHLNLWVDSAAYNVVETTHQSWLLAVIDCLADSARDRAPANRSMART